MVGLGTNTPREMFWRGGVDLVVPEAVVGTWATSSEVVVVANATTSRAIQTGM